MMRFCNGIFEPCVYATKVWWVRCWQIFRKYIFVYILLTIYFGSDEKNIIHVLIRTFHGVLMWFLCQHASQLNCLVESDRYRFHTKRYDSTKLFCLCQMNRVVRVFTPKNYMWSLLRCDSTDLISFWGDSEYFRMSYSVESRWLEIILGSPLGVNMLSIATEWPRSCDLSRIVDIFPPKVPTQLNCLVGSDLLVPLNWINCYWTC